MELKGIYKDFVDVKNSLLKGDSHLIVVKGLLSNPIMRDE